MAGLMLTTVTFGQQLTFKGQPVDSIEVVSSQGHYHFDDKGTTTSTNDHYVITFDKATNSYVTIYKRILSTFTCKPESDSEKVKKLSTGRIVERSNLEGFLSALSNTYLKPTFDNIGLNKEKFLALTNEKEILRVAKLYKEDWHFDTKRYSEKEDNEIIFKGCQNIDTFNLFLSTQFDTTGYSIVFDYWDEWDVYIKAGENHYHYESKYPNKFKQPWFDLSDTSTYLAEGDSTLGIPSLRLQTITSILNFDINTYLVSMLPKKFYRRNSINLDALMIYYIKWYLQRRDIISSYD
jgi:hypothetical protein